MTLPYSVSQWPLVWLELYNERAGIIEFDANVSRLEAEVLAEKEIREIEARTHGPVQHGLELKF